MVNNIISLIIVCLVSMRIQTYSSPDNTWIYCGHEIDTPVVNGPFIRRLVAPLGGFYTNYSDHILNMNPDEKKCISEWSKQHYGHTLVQLSTPFPENETRWIESVGFTIEEMPIPTASICPQDHGFLSDHIFEMLSTFKKIKHIELFDLEIGNKTANFEAVSKLTTLEYIGMPFDVKDEHFKYIANLPSLHFLNVSGTEINGDGLQYLHSLPKLRILDLRYTKMKNGSLKHLSRCPALETLLLSESNINDGDVLDLVELPNLKYVTLHRTSVTSNILSTLVRLKPLKRISLYKTKIEQPDIDKFLQDRPNIQLIPQPLDHRNFLVSRFYIEAYLGNRAQQEYRAKGYFTKDPIESLKWFLILASRKDDGTATISKNEISKQILALESQLDKSQIEEAHRRVEVFQFLSKRASYRPEIDAGEGLPIYQYELQKEE